MTDYDRVHREINQYIPDAPKMTKAELEQAILDSFYKGDIRGKYRHASSRLANGYRLKEGGKKIWEIKFTYGIRHVIRDTKGKYKRWLD